MLYPVLLRYGLNKIKTQEKYSSSLLILVVEKRLMAHEQSANWLFFKHLDISSFWFPFSNVVALLFVVDSVQILSVPFQDS